MWERKKNDPFSLHLIPIVHFPVAFLDQGL